MSHQKKRIAIYGGTQLSAAESRFVESLAYSLLTNLDVVIITGGFLYWPKKMPGAISTDFSVLQGAARFASENGINLENIFETWLPDPDVESDIEKKDVVRFREGFVKKLDDESAQVRRFSMIRDVDVVITVKGKKHTAVVLDFAITINKPAFPLTFTGGDSKKFWDIHKNRVKTWFNLSDDFMHELEIENMEESWSPETKNEILEKLIASIDYGLKKEVSNSAHYKKLQQEFKAETVTTTRGDVVAEKGNISSGSNYLKSDQQAKKKQLKLFLSYAHEDETLKDELDKSLIALKRDERISVWQDKNIRGGDQWDDTIKEELRNADMILLLISTDFLNSNYIWNTELKYALQRQEEGKVKVIPIYLRDAFIGNMPFKDLQGYLSPKKPVASFEGYKRDEAYRQIVEGINNDVNDWLNKNGG